VKICDHANVLVHLIGSREKARSASLLSLW